MALKAGPPKEVEADGKLGKEESGGKPKKVEGWDEEQDVIEDVSFVKSVEIGLF